MPRRLGVCRSTGHVYFYMVGTYQDDSLLNKKLREGIISPLA